MPHSGLRTHSAVYWDFSFSPSACAVYISSSCFGSIVRVSSGPTSLSQIMPKNVAPSPLFPRDSSRSGPCFTPTCDSSSYQILTGWNRFLLMSNACKPVVFPTTSANYLRLRTVQGGAQIGFLPQLGDGSRRSRPRAVCRIVKFYILDDLSVSRRLCDNQKQMYVYTAVFRELLFSFINVISLCPRVIGGRGRVVARHSNRMCCVLHTWRAQRPGLALFIVLLVTTEITIAHAVVTDKELHIHSLVWS